MRYDRLALFPALILSLSSASWGVPGAGSPPAFAQAYCIRCHGPNKHKADLRLDAVPLDGAFAGDFERIWGSAMERLAAGEMPPEEARQQPSPVERALMIDHIAGRLREAEAQRLATTERVSLHRLTREEYANTLHDLLGVTYVPGDPGGLPEEPGWHGFERVGSVLTISPAHIERYLAAGEAALDQALSPPDSRPRMLLRWMGPNVVLRPERDKPPAERWGYPNGAWRTLIPPNLSLKSYVGAGAFTLDVRRAGDYTVRIKASGLRPPGGSAPHMSLYCIDLNRTLLESDIEAPENQPGVFEFPVHLDAGEHVMDLYNAGPGLDRYNNAARTSTYIQQFHSIKEGRSPSQQKMTDDDGVPLFPLLIVDYVEWEGPSAPANGRELLGTGNRDSDQARRSLAQFAGRAFRRPVRDDEIDRLCAIAQRELDAGASFDAAVKQAMLVVLCSKDFLYLIEGSAQSPRPTVDDWELASRLSYFIWSTMPDDTLLDLARRGTLHETSILREQLSRMLADPRAKRFGEEFPREWLQLHNVGKFPPDKKLYPEYDELLERSMVHETTSYFQQVLTENLSLREFLTSDWTMLNGPLARHYGIPGIVDTPMRKVVLKPEYHRGGLLTQAAILSLTSDGTRQKPVNRGKWVLESILGKSVPPPPPNVGSIQPRPASQPKATVRMKLEAHRSNPTCAACHARIDPYGLAFDNYDAIGRWTAVERTRDGAGDDPPIDASGELPDGRKFADADGLKQLLAADVDSFAAAFTEKLATYALRRTMRATDREAIRKIAAQVKDRNYPLRDLIEALVTSDLFQKR